MQREELINKFVTTNEEVAGYPLSIVGNDLIGNDKPIAKKAKTGNFLLLTSVRLDISDLLIEQIVKNGKTFTRVDNFETLFHPHNIQSHLNNGNVKALEMVASLSDFDISTIDFSLYSERQKVSGAFTEAMAKLQAEYQPKVDAFNAKIDEQADRVLEYFRDLEEQQRKKREEERLAKLGQKAKKLIEKWDAGGSLEYGDSQVIVEATGSNRLRVRKTGADRYSVESSSGNNAGLLVIRTAFNKVAPYIWGTLKRDLWDRRIGSVRDYTLELSTRGAVKFVELGCQRVSLVELERFATAQGWPLDGSPAAR